jgi:hypothetical protein
MARAAAALHGGQRSSKHGFAFDAHGDVADNDGESGHGERHAGLNRVMHRLFKGVWGAGRVQYEPLDSRLYSDHRPDITLHGLGAAGVSILLDLKLFSSSSSNPASLGRAGASVGFGNTRPAARELVLGLRGRGSPADGCFNPATGAGYVAPKDGDYARPLRDGLEVVAMLFETMGGFSSDFFELLKRAGAEVSNRLTATQSVSMRRRRGRLAAGWLSRLSRSLLPCTLRWRTESNLLSMRGECPPVVTRGVFTPARKPACPECP